MAKFIFTYRQRVDYVPSQTDPNVISPWTKFFEGIGSKIVEPGQPVFQRAALAMARACPSIEQGGGVEVGVLAELPADHPAMLLRRSA
jgi:hypothetical protein